MILTFQLFCEGSRSTELNDNDFLTSLRNNCKNFSFDNDILWRSKDTTSALQIYNPGYRKITPVSFPRYFDRIEGNPNYPVERKKSLIGGTSKEMCRFMFGAPYMVIPFDNSELVFTPVFDLWSADDNRAKKSEMVNKEPIKDDMFLKVNYTKYFQIPYDELLVISMKYNLSSKGGKISNNMIPGSYLGYEFFTSSPCLLVHESKIDWLKSKLEN